MNSRRGSPSYHNTRRLCFGALPPPRQILGIAMFFFLLFHTLMVQRALEHHQQEGQQDSSASSTRSSITNNGHHRPLWHDHWKIRRTQSKASSPLLLNQESHKNVLNQVPIEASNHHKQQEASSAMPPPASVEIRSWGANLTTTPLIFVHIGKAGGGSIRARFSAARPHFGHKDWRRQDDDATYPVAVTAHDYNGTTSSTVPAYFCNSGHATFRSTPRELYEETLLCHATTPLGAAIACPDHLFALTDTCPHGCAVDDTACRQVYMGHNIVGAEWHWLPYKVMRQWWRDQYQAVLPTDLYQSFDQYLATLEPGNHDWCPYVENGWSRPRYRRDYRHKTIPCSLPLANAVDNVAYRILTHLQQQQQQQEQSATQRQLMAASQPHNMEDWSSLYASLPVLRTTIVREPFGWLVSKFFWQGNWHWHDLECDNILHATRLDGKAPWRRRLQEAQEEPRDEPAEEQGDDFYQDGSWQDGGDGAWDETEEQQGQERNNEQEEQYNGTEGQHTQEWHHEEHERNEWLSQQEDRERDHRSPQEKERARPKHPFPHYHPDSTIVSDADGYGWAHRYALLYIFYLCGEDCAARYEMGMGGGPDSEDHQTILDQLERQAANNLRQSFAVVGLLHETETYYDMLTARVQYLDMSLHPDIEGELHETGSNGYMAKCKAIFAYPGFQEALREASPAVAALERLYKVAVDVNRQQVRELALSPEVDPAVRRRLQTAIQKF